MSAQRPKYRLSDLVAQMNESNRHGEIDCGPAVGREFPNEETDEEFDAFLAAVDGALTEQFGPNHQAILAGDGSGLVSAFRWGDK